RPSVEASCVASRHSIRACSASQIVPARRPCGGQFRKSVIQWGREVRGGGLEPPRVFSPLAPQTSASANSAILAQGGAPLLTKAPDAVEHAPRCLLLPRRRRFRRRLGGRFGSGRRRRRFARRLGRSRGRRLGGRGGQAVDQG